MLIIDRQEKIIKCTDVDDSLDAIQEVQYSVSELEFKKYFVQMLIDGFRHAPKPIQDRWYNIVQGKLTSPVNIIGEDGKVLFVVPPIIDTSIVRQNDFANILTSVAARAEDMANKHQAFGDNVYTENMPAIEESLKPSTDQRLLEIVNYFIDKYPPNNVSDNDEELHEVVKKKKEVKKVNIGSTLSSDLFG